MYGIDVSHHQGNIRWKALAAATAPHDPAREFEFAIIKATEGTSWTDPSFEENWVGAQSFDFIRGAYHYFRPGLHLEQQVDHFRDTVGVFGPRDLIPWLDVESNLSGINGPAISYVQVIDEVVMILPLLDEAFGVRAGIYTGKWFWDRLPRDKATRFGQRPLWVATYYKDGRPGNPYLPPGWTRYDIHQYSRSARLPGITDNTVDLNWAPEGIEHLLGSRTNDLKQEMIGALDRTSAQLDAVRSLVERM